MTITTPTLFASVSSSGNVATAAAESNKAIWKVAFTANPTSVIQASYERVADWTASAESSVVTSACFATF